MKEYRKVAKFKFKNNEYIMYLDDNNKRFFLRVDANNNLNYVTIEELLNLTQHFTSIPLVMNAQIENSGNKIKLIPKVIMNGMAVTLSLSLLTGCIPAFNQTIKPIGHIGSTASQTLDEKTAADFISIDIPDQKEGYEQATYFYDKANNTLFIYDMDYLNVAFNYDSVTLEQLNEVIASNNGISPTFKGLLYEFCTNVTSTYPDADLRVLYENLKSLEVIECDKAELVKLTHSSNSYGCYSHNDNKIYVLEGCNFEKHTWGYQVIMHEFSHCMRTGTYENNGTKIKVDSRDYKFNDELTLEALNSLFAVSVLGYDEDHITYQLQSNYHKVMIDCMDNYDLEDYANHSLSYYVQKLDEFNGDENKASVMLELIKLQYDDMHSEDIDIEESEFYDLYDYIAKMYFDKYIKEGTSYDEALEIANDLIDKIDFGTSVDYNIDYNHFYDYLNTYCDSIGIQKSGKLK